VKLEVAKSGGRLMPSWGRRLLFYGRTYICTCCNARLRAWRPQGLSRRLARCPICGSLERHRLMHHWLERDLLPMVDSPRILHVAPERPIQALLMSAGAYLSLDLERDDVDLRADIADVPLPDGSIDVLVASHVLEHVCDDTAALREIHRLLSPDGVAVLLVPWSPKRTSTYEDPTVTDPQSREQLFGQWDHVRLYGADLPDRLKAAGLEIERIDHGDLVSCAEATLYGFQIGADVGAGGGETLWLARRACS